MQRVKRLLACTLCDLSRPQKWISESFTPPHSFSGVEWVYYPCTHQHILKCNAVYYGIVVFLDCFANSSWRGANAESASTSRKHIKLQSISDPFLFAMLHHRMLVELPDVTANWTTCRVRRILIVRVAACPQTARVSSDRYELKPHD